MRLPQLTHHHRSFARAILLLSRNNGRITKIFSKKPLEFLGEISYSIYILQVPVYTFGISVLKRLGITNSISVFFILMVVLIIVSMLSYLWIEKPFRREKTCSKGSLEKSLLT